MDIYIYVYIYITISIYPTACGPPRHGPSQEASKPPKIHAGRNKEERGPRRNPSGQAILLKKPMVF